MRERTAIVIYAVVCLLACAAIGAMLAHGV